MCAASVIPRTPSPAESTARAGYWTRLLPLLTVLACVTRVPSFRHPLWSPDEGYLAVQARMLAHGGTLYETVVDRKPPLVPLLYQAAFALDGSDSLTVVRVLAVLAQLLTAVLLASLARRRWGDRAGGTAGVLYLLVSIGVNPEDAQAAGFEVFMLPCTAAALWCADRRRWTAAGLAVAAAFLVKQTGGAVLLPVLWLWYRGTGTERRGVVGRAGGAEGRGVVGRAGGADGRRVAGRAGGAEGRRVAGSAGGADGWRSGGPAVGVGRWRLLGFAAGVDRWRLAGFAAGADRRRLAGLAGGAERRRSVGLAGGAEGRRLGGSAVGAGRRGPLGFAARAGRRGPLGGVAGADRWPLLGVAAGAERRRLAGCAAGADRRSLLGLVAGAVLPVLAAALLTDPAGFLFWTVTGSGAYASLTGSELHVLLRGLGNAAILAAACAGLLPLLARKTARTPRPGAELWLWLAASGAAVCAGFHFFGHYYLQLLPPLALLATAALQHAPRERTTRTLLVSACCCVLFLTWGLLAPRPELAHAQRLADATARRTDPGEKVLIWGMHPETYWLADRAPASRYLTAGLLTNYSGGRDGPQVGERYAVPGTLPVFRAELAAHAPALVVDDSRGLPYTPDRIPTLRRLLTARYEEVERVDGAVLYARTP
ncbi:glycosyltransferase family 39 protein [Streptomyces sp. NPDC056734]|uniref:glycosyltransferase family 39 protein n=1 Tax=Streptomyces sp. NPDC056734 TaxID=3345931 RepID=UPI0036A3D1A7